MKDPTFKIFCSMMAIGLLGYLVLALLANRMFNVDN